MRSASIRWATASARGVPRAASGATCGLLASGPPSCVLPPVGLVAAAGLIVLALVAALEGPSAGRRHVGACTARWRASASSREQAIRYEADIVADRFLVIVHGSQEDIDRARAPCWPQSMPRRCAVPPGRLSGTWEVRLAGSAGVFGNEEKITMRQDPPSAPRSFWNLPLQSLLTTLACDAQGLSTDESAHRLVAYGENTLGAKRQRWVALEFLSHFRSPLVLLLLAACIVSAAMGDASSAIVIAAIVVGSVTLEFVQERRAPATRPSGVAAVRRAPGERAARRRVPVRVPAAQVVPSATSCAYVAGDLVRRPTAVVRWRRATYRAPGHAHGLRPTGSKSRRRTWRPADGDLSAALNARPSWVRRC